MKKRFLLIFLLFLAALAFGAGCSTTEKKVDTANSKLDQTLKIGVLFIEDNLPFFLAEAEDRFTKAGLSVELVPFPSAVERDAAIQAGQIDGEAADIIAAGLLKKGGTDVRISSVTLGVTPAEGRFVLLGSPESNFKSAQDLNGVEIAISENTIIEYVADQLLAQNGLDKGSIKKIAVPKMPIRLQMLTNNQVKAALLPDPLASLAEKQGAKVILDDTKSVKNVSQVVLLFRKDSIDKKQAAIKGLLQVYAEAARDLTTGAEKYRPLLLEKAKIPDPIKDSYKSPAFSAPQVPAKTDVMDVVAWMVDKKLLDQPISYEELVDSSLLD